MYETTCYMSIYQIKYISSKRGGVVAHMHVRASDSLIAPVCHTYTVTRANACAHETIWTITCRHREAHCTASTRNM